MAGYSVFRSSSLLLRSALLRPAPAGAPLIERWWPRHESLALQSSLPFRSRFGGIAPALVQSRSFFFASSSQQSGAGGGERTQKDEDREKEKQRKTNILSILIAASALGAIALSFFQPFSPPSQAPPPPGDPLKPDSRLLCIGEEVLQNFTPVQQIHQTVCGLHFYDGQPERQLVAHHYCSHLNEDFRQCVIYDGEGKDAKLIGIEYIISRKLFEKLPEEEKKYWHSHAYEVRSGVLVAPGVPETAERKEMAKLVDTYGKTWHTWQVDLGHELPLGPATLMLSLTKDGQANPAVVKAKDERTGISTEERKRKRASLEYPRTIAKGADQGFYPNKNLK